MHLGLTQYTACSEGTKFVENAARLGVEGAEPFIGSPDDKLLNLPTGKLHELRNKAMDLGVRIPSACLGAFNNDSSLVESSGKAKAIAFIEKFLDFSHALGSDLMLLCSYIESHPDSEIKKTNMINVVQEILPYAADLDVRIAIESPLPADELKEMIQTIDSEQVGVYFDTGNAVANGYDPVEEIETLDQDIFAVHIKDCHSLQLLGLHLGNGDVDFPGSVEALKKIEYDDWLMIETSGDDEEAVKEDIQRLRAFWNEVGED